MTAPKMDDDERACECTAGCDRCWGSGVRAATFEEMGNPCSRCDAKGAEVRYSLGIYAGRYCPRCWRDSGYRDEPASAFDPADAGETW